MSIIEALAFDIVGLLLVAVIAFVAVAFSNRFKIPHPILLVLVGFGLKYLEFQGKPLISPPDLMVIGFAIIALAIITFDNTSRVLPDKETKEIDLTWRLAITSIVLHAILLTPVIVLLLYQNNLTQLPFWILGIFVALLLAETSLDTISEHPKHIKTRQYRLIVQESIVNTPIILLIAFFFLEVLEVLFPQGEFVFSPTLFNHLGFTFVTGIATALVVGIILLKWIKERVHHTSAPLLIIGVLSTYILAERMGGSGLVAVVFLGLFFGKSFVEKKAMLEEFTEVTASLFEVLVFILLGFLISLDFSINFIITTFILYLFMILVRFVAVSASTKKFSSKEKWLMTLNAPLGISVAAIVLLLGLTSNIPGMIVAIDALVLVIFYSNIVHWAVQKQFK